MLLHHRPAVSTSACAAPMRRPILEASMLTLPNFCGPAGADATAASMLSKIRPCAARAAARLRSTASAVTPAQNNIVAIDCAQYAMDLIWWAAPCGLLGRRLSSIMRCMYSWLANLLHWP